MNDVLNEYSELEVEGGGWWGFEKSRNMTTEIRIHILDFTVVMFLAAETLLSMHTLHFLPQVTVVFVTWLFFIHPNLMDGEGNTLREFSILDINTISVK